MEEIIQAAVGLQNFLKKNDSSKEDEHRYCPGYLIDREDEDGNFIEGDWGEQNQLIIYRNLTRLVGAPMVEMLLMCGKF